MDTSSQMDSTPEIPVITVEKRHKSADFSKAVRICHIELKTNSVQIAFEHVYSRADNALFACTKALRRQGKVAVAKATEKTLSEIFDTFSSELSDTLLNLETSVKEKVPAQMRAITYDRVRAFDAPSSNSFSSRLINLTVQLDTLVSTVDILELNNVLSPDEADQTAQSWIKRYRRFTNAIQLLRADTARSLKSTS